MRLNTRCFPHLCTVRGRISAAPVAAGGGRRTAAVHGQSGCGGTHAAADSSAGCMIVWFYALCVAIVWNDLSSFTASSCGVKALSVSADSVWAVFHSPPLARQPHCSGIHATPGSRAAELRSTPANFRNTGTAAPVIQLGMQHPCAAAWHADTINISVPQHALQRWAQQP